MGKLVGTASYANTHQDPAVVYVLCLRSFQTLTPIKNSFIHIIIPVLVINSVSDRGKYV